MRKIILLPALCMILTVAAQQTEYPVEGKLTGVKEWGSLSILIGNAFFDATQDSIVMQIGLEEFIEMKTKCSSSGWPEGFYQSGLNEEEDKAYEEKLNRLHKYRIASYTHIYNGTVYDRYVILRIPYEKNKTWDQELKWMGNIYFLVKEKDCMIE
jgi:hypothetical protein